MGNPENVRYGRAWGGIWAEACRSTCGHYTVTASLEAALSPEPDDYEELPLEIWETLSEEQLRQIVRDRGGCTCFLNAPCSSCVNPVTWGEARAVGLECFAIYPDQP